MNLKPGDKLTIFYNFNNINNKTVEVRAIVDNTVAVVVGETTYYHLIDLSFLEMLNENGNLSIESKS